jgi:hypothetical protein
MTSRSKVPVAAGPTMPLDLANDPYDGLPPDAERPMTHGPSEICRFVGPHPKAECRILEANAAGIPTAELPPRAKYRLDMLRAHQVYTNAAGERLPGVTTVLGMLNKPALLPWAWDLGSKGIKLEAARQQAADIGTIGHALCEAHLRGMDFDPETVVPELLAKAETAFLNFLEYWDREQLTVQACELRMVSEVMQVGGTLDILARRTDGRLVLVDLKTSKALYPEMLVQAATYAAMHTEVSGQEISDVVLVRIPKADDEGLEVRTVGQRTEKVQAFAALAEARRQLQRAGMRV